MAVPVPTIEPTQMRVADSLQWDKTLADYPASAWTLTYRILPQAAGTPITLTATANGATHQIRYASGATSAYVVGDYWMVGTVRSNVGDDRFEVYAGSFTILANPITAASYDGRSYLQRILDLLQTSIEANEAPRNVIRYSFGGVVSEVRTLEEAMKARDMIKAQIRAESAAAAGVNRRVLTRFGNPR